ncbi:MAG TPA: RNA polymerase sigma factor [Candidatus Polarisedimenticolaceae bacterium]|nr:RNA polymerase sigma factor [Candidatus Polarisedimenticolaceae bacterium]
MEHTLAIEERGDAASHEDARIDTIGRLFDSQHARLYRLALRLTWGHDDALDLVQECFVRAMESRLPEEPEVAERWLTRVLVNLCRDRQRRGAVRRAYDGVLRNEAPAATEDPVMSAAVRDAVLALPVRQRAVVVLHEIEGRTLQEVAALLGIAAVTARWHLHVALRSLRKELSR